MYCYPIVDGQLTAMQHTAMLSYHTKLTVSSCAALHEPKQAATRAAICMCISLSLYIYIYMYKCISLSLYIYIYICMNIDIYIYKEREIQIYKYIYIYMYREREIHTYITYIHDARLGLRTRGFGSPLSTGPARCDPISKRAKQLRGHARGGQEGLENAAPARISPADWLGLRA